ncbi:hypothetical protein NQ314_009935 [Rhamnusium bicolor]|uniref:UGGT thioredoxin-like domain-containing protein n=1 Tax=Rhamnusium bicolor TaxID=1586634 RepID=A0AAV8XVD9_9CUCU|nr:hypothetical protein NQ314_009935 [Rhamnusium bicolor]
MNVFIIDPTDPENRELLKLVESFVIHTAPLRIGIVFNVNDSTTLNGLEDAGVAMQCALNYVTQKKDAPTALGFIRSILGSADGKVTVENVKDKLKREYGDDPDDILGKRVIELIIPGHLKLLTCRSVQISNIF